MERARDRALSAESRAGRALRGPPTVRGRSRSPRRCAGAARTYGRRSPRLDSRTGRAASAGNRRIRILLAATAEFGSCSPCSTAGPSGGPLPRKPRRRAKTTEAGVAAVALMTETPRATQMERNTWTETGGSSGVDPGEHRRGSGPQASGSILTVWTPLLAKKVDRGRATPLAEAANMKENRRRPGVVFPRSRAGTVRALARKNDAPTSGSRPAGCAASASSGAGCAKRPQRGGPSPQ